MPIYEYICENCGNEFELLVFRNDEPACTKCGDKDPRKKMSACAFSVGTNSKAASSTAGSGTAGSGCSSCSSSSCASCH